MLPENIYFLGSLFFTTWVLLKAKYLIINDKMKRTLVLGASPNSSRYAYKAVSLLKRHGIETFPVGIKTGSIEGIQIINGKPIIENIHTVTLYLGYKAQQEYYDYILALNPKRVIFNPETENDELMQLLEEKNIECIEACTLVMLGTGQF